MRFAIRALLAAGLLIGALVPRSLGYDYARMYTYSSLTREGSSVYAFGSAELEYPSRVCAWPYGTDCSEWYTSWIQIDLYKDGEWQGTEYGESWDWAAVAGLSAEIDAGSWELAALGEIEVVWDDWENGEEIETRWDFLSDLSEDELTIDPEISISSGQIAEDGDGAYFDVTVGLGSPTGYEWSFDYPSGARNNPDVDFSDPYDDSTNTDAHWFAYPDGACTASASAIYDITATVGFQSGPVSDTTMLDVVVPWYPAGVTIQPTLVLYATYYQSGGLWRVHPSTYFARTYPTEIVYIPTSSQFYSKANAHEQVHWDQYAPGGSYHLNEDLWNPTAARNAIINLTAATEQALDNLVDATVDSYDQSQFAIDQSRAAQAETQAYGVSDNISPRYIYQASCE